MNHADQITLLTTEYHTIRGTEFDSDEDYRAGFHRREAIKKELLAILEALAAADLSAALEGVLAELRLDRYLLLKKRVDLALDRMQGVEQIPAPQSPWMVRDAITDGTTEECLMLLNLFDARRSELTFMETFAEHAIAIRFGQAEPDGDLFVKALDDDNDRDSRWLAYSFAEQFSWAGMTRFQMEDEVNDERLARWPLPISRWEYQDSRFVGKTAHDLNQLLGDPRVAPTTPIKLLAEQVFPEACQPGLEALVARRNALRASWPILSETDPKVVEAFLVDGFTTVFEPTQHEPEPIGPFQVRFEPAPVIVHGRYGSGYEAQSTDEPSHAIACDGDRVVVGTAGGAFVFDRNGEFLMAIPAATGRPVLQLEWNGERLAILQPQQVAIVDVATGELEHRVPIFAMNDKARVAWNPSGTRLAIYGYVIEVYDATTWKVEHQQLRLEEEWPDTETFCWIDDDEFLATVAVYLDQPKPKRVTTAFTHLDDPDRRRARKTRLVHAARVPEGFFAVERKRPGEGVRAGWYKRRGQGWATTPWRHAHTATVREVRSDDARLVFRTDDGLYHWHEAEPEHICGVVDAYTLSGDQLVTLKDGVVSFIDF